MLLNRNRLFVHQYLNADDGVPSGDPGQPPADPPKPPKVEFTPEQQQHLNNLLAAERKATEEKTALKLKADADAKAKAEEEQRERDAAEKRGEFEQVRKDLESKVESVTGERDALAGEADALRSYFDAQYTAALKELPEVVTAFKPDDDASFAEKSAWLIKAQEQAAKVAKGQAPGNHPNPNPASGKFDLDAEVAKARASGKYRA